MTLLVRTPWDGEPAPAAPSPVLSAPTPTPKRRGRRPAASSAAANAAPAWLYHHLTITGPGAEVGALTDAARGPGVIPWRLDLDRIEEDIFNLAVSRRAGPGSLSVAGCHILARQFRQRIAARDERAAALIGRGGACPFDLHVLLPVPDAILRRGPTDPVSLDWLARHWGTRDGLRKVAERPNPSAGRRLPSGHAVISYGFFTAGDTPHAATGQLATRWPALRFALTPRPPD